MSEDIDEDTRLDKLVAKLSYGPRYEAVLGEDEEWEWWCAVTDEAAKEIQYLRAQLSIPKPNLPTPTKQEGE